MNTSRKLVLITGTALAMVFAGAATAHQGHRANCTTGAANESCPQGPHAAAGGAVGQGGKHMHGQHGQGKHHGAMAMHGGKGGAMPGGQHQHRHGNPAPVTPGADTPKN